LHLYVFSHFFLDLPSGISLRNLSHQILSTFLVFESWPPYFTVPKFLSGLYRSQIPRYVITLLKTWKVSRLHWNRFLRTAFLNITNPTVK
jgi:hypothetical protein